MCHILNKLVCLDSSQIFYGPDSTPPPPVKVQVLDSFPHLEEIVQISAGIQQIWRTIFLFPPIPGGKTAHLTNYIWPVKVNDAFPRHSAKTTTVFSG